MQHKRVSLLLCVLEQLEVSVHNGLALCMCANTEQCCVCDCVVCIWYTHISAAQCIDSSDNIDTKVGIAILYGDHIGL